MNDRYVTTTKLMDAIFNRAALLEGVMSKAQRFGEEVWKQRRREGKDRKVRPMIPIDKAWVELSAAMDAVRKFGEGADED